MAKEWFLLQFKPNSHKKAIKNLNQQGYETFLPLHKYTQKKGSLVRSITHPLFPGYMFVAFDKTNTNWYKINNTYGVSRLITFNSVLKAIPSNLIDELMMRYNSSGELLIKKIFHKGERVKLLTGPFANFIVTVEKYETNQRIWVLIDLMGRKTKMQEVTENIQLQS